MGTFQWKQNEWKCFFFLNFRFSTELCGFGHWNVKNWLNFIERIKWLTCRAPFVLGQVTTSKVTTVRTRHRRPHLQIKRLVMSKLSIFLQLVGDDRFQGQRHFCWNSPWKTLAFERKLQPFDSSWNALQLCFWVRQDRIRRSAAISRQSDWRRWRRLAVR